MRDLLFTYAVLLHPTEEDRKDGKRAVVVVAPPSLPVVAKSVAEVTMIASREIPSEYLDRSDRLEVAVSPF